jgi:alkylated DNA repair dioxygenase AlkB
MQSSLFENDTSQFDLPGADIRYVERFITGHQAYFDTLHREVQWQRDTIEIAGKSIPIPRLNAWYGDIDAGYSYSGIVLKPLPWTPLLMQLKSLVDRFCQTQFNSVLINLYRDGSDSVAWHSDNEPELGPNPMIASLSFGDTRRFSLRGPVNVAPGVKQQTVKQQTVKQQTMNIDLAGGSLLVMAGQTQRCWRHQVAKTKKNVGPRINLTFRRITPPTTA